MIAVIGRHVVNSTVIRYGRTSRDRNRDSGYAASTAHATVSAVALPHSTRLLSIGVNVISSVHTAEKLSSVGVPGADTRNVASPSTEASTSQASGRTKAAATTSSAASAASRRRSRGDQRRGERNPGDRSRGDRRGRDRGRAESTDNLGPPR